MHQLERHLQQQWAHLGTQRLVVAVSGGPDSLALLMALCTFVPTRHIHVYHLDHGWRDAQSAAEAQFVAQTAQQLGVAHTIEYVNVAQHMPHPNASAASRIVRYQRLAHCASTTHADHVLVAHTRDDQAETFLMHLLRGSGSTGLAGMRPQVAWQDWAPPTIIGHAWLTRPLLDIDRNVITDYCTTTNLAPRHDPSNTKTTALRVRMRHTILPQLRHEQPQLNAILARTAQQLADQEDALQSIIRQQWHTLTTPYHQGTLLRRSSCNTLPVALQRTAIRMALTQHYHQLTNLHWEHIEAMRLSLIDGQAIHTPPPQPFHVAVHADGLIVGDVILPTAPQYAAPQQSLAHGAQIVCGDYTLSCTFTDAAPHNTSWQVALIPDVVYHLRTRQPGDRIAIGHQHHKRLQDVFVDAKTPALFRQHWPIVIHAHQVVWVPGHRVDPAYLAPAGTPALLCTLRQNQV